MFRKKVGAGEGAQQKAEEVREDGRKPRRISGQMERRRGEKMEGDRWRRKEGSG